jgi:group I intron endonuclease
VQIHWAIHHANLPKMPGVYAVRHIQSGDTYIGATLNIRHRAFCHLSTLRSWKHRCHKLQHYYDDYGEQSIVFGVIEQCDQYLVNERERYWINTYKPALNHNKAPKSYVKHPHWAASPWNKSRLPDPVPRAPRTYWFSRRKSQPA